MSERKMALKSLPLTNGGAFLLKNILPTMNWYKGIPLVQAVEAQQLPGDLLSDLKPPAGTAQTQDEWSANPLTIAITQAAYQGVRACLRFYLANAAIELKPAALQLIQAFGLLEE